MADTHEPKNAIIFIYIMLISFGLVILSIGLLYYFDRVNQWETHVKVELAPNTKLQQLRADEDELLHQYVYLDRSKNIVRIPIDRAMELEAQSPWRQTAPITKSNDGGTTHGQP